MTFKLTRKQTELEDLQWSDAQHVMAYGGSRSGKTFQHCIGIVPRALKEPGSKHLIVRFRFNDVARSIGRGTLVDVLSKMNVPYKMNKVTYEFDLFNKSKIILGGLDDKQRVEKVLGDEYITVYFNECSQISFDSVCVAWTRLAEKGEYLTPKRFYDCNPPPKTHWTYKLFMQGLNPIDNTSFLQKTCSILMNPIDNIENISSDYLDTLSALPTRQKLRFLEGKFLDLVEGALWRSDWICNNRLISKPDSINRIVVAIDPATTANKNSDETGIIVAASDQDKGYILDDLSLKGTPNQWAVAAIKAYDKYMADAVIAESNQGGDMVRVVIQQAAQELFRQGQRSSKHINVNLVNATKGKAIRAEPISDLYEQGKISHIGIFDTLEEQMTTFTNQYDRNKDGSPDRLDALVWALTDLMLVPPSTGDGYVTPKPKRKVAMHKDAVVNW